MDPKHPERQKKIVYMVQGIVDSMAMKAACRLDIFSKLKSGENTVEKLAKSCNATERGLEILLNYFVASDLLTKNDNIYGTTLAVDSLLLKDSPISFLAYADFFQSDKLLGNLSKLEDTIRNGFSASSIISDYDIWAQYAEFTPGIMAKDVFETLKIAKLNGIEEPIKVIDIAAGSGLYGCEILKSCPNAKVYALDNEKVLEVAGKFVEKNGSGLRERWIPLPGSAFDLECMKEFAEYDYCVVGNFFMHFTVEVCVKLFKNIHSILKTGGKFIIIDTITHSDRVSPVYPARWSINMLASTPSGSAHSFEEYRQALKESGFHSFIEVDNLPSQEQLISCTK